MPELPEVETTRRGIEPHLIGQEIIELRVHQPQLRWPIPAALFTLKGATITAVKRRGKYLLIQVPAGQAIIHLGMSGSLRLCHSSDARRKHDHVELTLAGGKVLRYHDPRRFGCWLWQADNEATHKLLSQLGPEPLGAGFNGAYLFQQSRRRTVAIKNLIMNSHVVVGVGNIYASESLFLSGIRPGKAARRITQADAHRLAAAIKQVLKQSIKMGGTTLRDFYNSDGNPGYFKQSLNVYGRADEACRICGQLIKQRVLAQRSTFYCSQCQH